MNHPTDRLAPVQQTNCSLPSRRQFVSISTAVALAASSSPLIAKPIQHSTKARRMLKTLKEGMVRGGGWAEKFRLAKQAGFDGIELNSPGFVASEVRKAIDETGLPVDGTVCSSHWKITHTSPDAAQRAQALADLRQAIRDTHAVGGHTVLLVVGVGKDGPEKEIWPRAVENIRQAIPTAAELGVTIAIENVWNQFLYDHAGSNNQTAEKFVQFVDEFNSPVVGMQFDIGNHWKFGDPAAWIRALGTRIVKLDIKGFSRAQDKPADITEDDIHWAEVRQALDDISFEGWVAAEVGGGDLQRLRLVAKQIDEALNLSAVA